MRRTRTASVRRLQRTMQTRKPSCWRISIWYRRMRNRNGVMPIYHPAERTQPAAKAILLQLNQTRNPPHPTKTLDNEHQTLAHHITTPDNDLLAKNLPYLPPASHNLPVFPPDLHNPHYQNHQPHPTAPGPVTSARSSTNLPISSATSAAPNAPLLPLPPTQLRHHTPRPQRKRSQLRYETAIRRKL